MTQGAAAFRPAESDQDEPLDVEGCPELWRSASAMSGVASVYGRGHLRYVRMRSPRQSSLMLAEVEVY